MAKEQFDLEYHFNTSAKVLFPRLSTAVGLNEWFADEVTENDNIFTFRWDKEERSAELLAIKDLRNVRFHWTDDEDEGTFFEFKLTTTELTDDLALQITDFADADEVTEMTELWDAQIVDLKRVLGA
jgi:uncharacterized protein YndB with AHSA1/START domain